MPERLIRSTRAVKQRPERPVVVATRGSQNGFVASGVRGGARDDVLTYPVVGGESPLHAREGARSPEGGYAVGGSRCPAHLHPRSEGRHGEDARLHQPLGCTWLERDPARRACGSRPPVRGCRARTRGSCPSGRSTSSRSPGLRTTHDKLDRHLMRHSSGVRVSARADTARPCECDHRRLHSGRLRVAQDDVRRRGRRHTAGLHTRGDCDNRRVDGRLHGGACSTRSRSRT